LRALTATPISLGSPLAVVHPNGERRTVTLAHVSGNHVWVTLWTAFSAQVKVALRAPPGAPERVRARVGYLLFKSGALSWRLEDPEAVWLGIRGTER
jgi:hypothetical protein